MALAEINLTAHCRNALPFFTTHSLLRKGIRHMNAMPSSRPNDRQRQRRSRKVLG